MKRAAITLALALLGCCGRVSAQAPSPLPPVVKPSGPPPIPALKPSGAPLPPVVRPSTPPPPPPMDSAISGKVWGALIYATEGSPAGMPDSVPADLADLPRRLGTVFSNYHRFEILGSRSQDIFRQYESWVVPSKELFLKLDSKGPAVGGGIRLDLQFWRMDKVLIKADVALRPHSPLFIAGPRWREGKLIFVLLLTEGGRKK